MQTMNYSASARHTSLMPVPDEAALRACLEAHLNICTQLLLKVDLAGVALCDQLIRALDKWENASFAGIRIRLKLLEGTDRFDKRASQAEAVATKVKSSF